ncbi:MAG: hypothetical protein ACOCP8_06780 [archaeon]
MAKMSENSSFELIPILKTPNVKPGGKVEINFFITGFGIFNLKEIDSKRSKIYFNFSNLKIKDKIKYEKFIVSDKKSTGYKVYTGEKYSSFEEIEKERSSFVICNILELLLPRGENNLYAPIHGELSHNPPIKVTFNISNKINPGDYELNFALIYGSNKKVMGISHKKSTLHVKSFFERNQTIFYLIGTIIAILTLIFTIGPSKIFEWVDLFT